MLLLYFRITLRLSAFGRGIGDIHHNLVNASFTRMRSTLTHCAGDGSRAGLYQTNSWHKIELARLENRSSAFRTTVDITGSPRSHALPISTTIDPSHVKQSRNRQANPESQRIYSRPLRLPYLFLCLVGMGER